MTTSALAAILTIGAIVHIWRSPSRVVGFFITLGLVTLGYISGNGDTDVGHFLDGVVDNITKLIDAIASAY